MSRPVEVLTAAENAFDSSTQRRASIVVTAR